MTQGNARKSICQSQKGGAITLNKYWLQYVRLIFFHTCFGRTDAEAEAPILWPPDGKSQLTGKDPDTRKDWGQGEKGATEDEMFGWHHQHNGHGSDQTAGNSEGQKSLMCCSSWDYRELDMIQWLNNNKYLPCFNSRGLDLTSAWISQSNFSICGRNLWCRRVSP